MQGSREGLWSVHNNERLQSKGRRLHAGKSHLSAHICRRKPMGCILCIASMSCMFGFHSDSRATWSEALKITFKGKDCSLCTFLMQRLSPRGFGDCSTWSPGTVTALPEPPGQSPVLLAVTCCRHSSVGTELCWETAQRVWQHSPAALPLLYATALHQPPAPQESQLTLSPLGPCTAPHTCINFVLRLQAATPRAGAEARTDVRMLSRGDPGPLLSFHWINATPNIPKKKKNPDRQLNWTPGCAVPQQAPQSSHSPRGVRKGGGNITRADFTYSHHWWRHTCLYLIGLI